MSKELIASVLLFLQILMSSCSKEISFEINDSVKDTVIKIDVSRIGDPSRVTKKIISFWSDTILINGIKIAATKDTVVDSETVDYYGINSLYRFEKYKAKHWYIKHEYSFTPW